jgi:ABC-type lipoprotein export system ATPase subunit
MFQQLNAQESITIVLVTHDANVARYAGRVITIHDGAIMDRSFGVHLKDAPLKKDVLPVAAAMGGTG